MPSPMPQQTHLEREYLPIRAKILEVAAALDRIERAEQQDSDPKRWEQLQEGIRLLLSVEGERAEQVQLLFSRTYDEQWRSDMKVAPR